MATGYAGMAEAPSGRTQAAGLVASTETEALSASLGENRRRLRNTMDLIEQRLDGFAPRPQPIAMGNKATSDAPEPPPGTLASLRCMADTISVELNRLEEISSRLRELL